MTFKASLRRLKVPSILLLGLVYGAYVLIGGVIFWQLEGDLNQRDINRILANKREVLTTYSCLNQNGLEAVAQEEARLDGEPDSLGSLYRSHSSHTCFLRCVAQEDLEWLRNIKPCFSSQVVQDASKVGLSLRGNRTTDGFWKFTSSAVFAATVVTTIGYGNISPSSTAGQIFCVFFALFGIPLNVVVLNKVGKYMLALGRTIAEFLEKRTGRPKCTRFLVHLVSFLCGVVLFFIVPMLVFQTYEGWTYSQTIYYCFITLSTIGFGDFVADSNPDRSYPDWYSFIMASWIFFGLAWLALLINHAIDILERLNGYFKQRLGRREPSTQTETESTDAPPPSPSQ
ncbi:potassium channel subfamily K member 17 [Synchiropus splendidus]|uniref:potassium channel subfamily K member 17 n=1 Tax=Synchiropus splendidus TaxID=270530 RepID=UPI00237DD8CE|nr:potassium channel subfamily K member 17 [Synchiropus splendidus]